MKTKHNFKKQIPCCVKRYVGTGCGIYDKWEPLEEEEIIHE